MNGTISRLSVDKGFGFIKGDDGGKDYFMHRSALKDGVFEMLREGQAVTFDPGQGEKGPRAENVRVA